MPTIEPSRDLTSAPQLAAHLQCTIAAIERAADKLGMLPALRINLVPHYDADQIEWLSVELTNQPKTVNL